MRVTKLIERALRLWDRYTGSSWYEQLHMSPPPPPYYERLRPREDSFAQSYWLRIRSNPYRRNYH